MLVRTYLTIQRVLKEECIHCTQEEEIAQEETQAQNDQNLIHDLKLTLNSTTYDTIINQPHQLVKKISSLLFSKPSSSVLYDHSIPTHYEEEEEEAEEVNDDDDDVDTIYYKRKEDYLSIQPSKKSLLSIQSKIMSKPKVYPGFIEHQHQEEGMPVFKPSTNKPKSLFKRMKTLIKHRKKKNK